jgi:protoporphyrin/coproporphyrin ferrochelatase
MHAPTGPTGVLLVNVGTPEAPTAAAVRAYLAEFLGDPDVVRLPRFLWLPLLHGVILPFRARKSARLYGRIWTERGSPLILHSRALSEALATELGPGFRVALAMRYGRPSIAKALDELAECGEIVLVPLFPQYSTTTTGSVVKAVRAQIAKRGAEKSLRTVTAFFDEPAYVAAIAALVREHAGLELDHYLISFHGLPLSVIDAGDPYQVHCERTAAALAKELGLATERWTLCYQSRFGREQWLGPQAIEIVPELARRAPRVGVVCPGFAADCLETLEEIHGQLGELFRRSGGEQWSVVPCLDSAPPFVSLLAALVRRRAQRQAAPASATPK